jgi:hypothetical protein
VNIAVFFFFLHKVQHGVFSYNECIFVLCHLWGAFLPMNYQFLLTVCFGVTHAYFALPVNFLACKLENHLF